MRILWLSSILFLFGCSQKTSESIVNTSIHNNCLSTLKPKFETVLFNTQVDITSHHLSGLLLIKKMQGDTTRVVFTNEMGLKYFDFEFTTNNFKVIYCMKKLNKKIIINQLKKNFSLILMNRTDLNAYQLVKTDSVKYYKLDGAKDQTYYITDTGCTKIIRMEIVDGEKKKILLHLKGDKNGMADEIAINYQTFKFDINLKQIER